MDNIADRIANLSPAKRALLEQKLQQKRSSNLTQSSIIPRRANPTIAPLSLIQQRLWVLNQLQPDSSFYNMPKAFRLHGSLDIAALKQTLDTLLERHESLRTTFVVIDGSPMQVIAQQWSLDLPLIDLSNHSDSDRQTKVLEILEQEAQRPFDLTSDLMLRARLIRLQEQEHVLLLVLHHIIADGWSLGVLAQELTVLYQAFVNQQPSPLPNLPIQYGDYAEWQQKTLTKDGLEEQLTYWRKQLDASPVLELPTDYSRSPIQSFKGRNKLFSLEAQITQRLKHLSQTSGTTLFVTLLTAFATLLSRYSGQDDIVIGSPMANRNQRETEPLIGLFLNTLPFRLDLSGDLTFRELLDRSKQVVLETFAHQDVPFEQLAEELHPNRDPSRSPWFQVLCVLQNFPWQPFQFSGLTLEPLFIETKTSKFDLTLGLTEQNGCLDGGLNYNTELFTDATVDRMVGHLQTLLTAIATNPDQPVSQLPLLTTTEQQQLLEEWTQRQASYPQHCIHELIEAQAQCSPEAIAVIAEEQQITYRELNDRANQLAHYLRTLGIAADRLVGLCVERSLDMLVGMLGILKAGGAYVPLDPAYPIDRIEFMLADANPVVVITHDRLKARLPASHPPIICLDTDWDSIAQQPATNLSGVSSPDQLAYVIYTSGSTGQPKGVMVSHRSLVNFTTAAIAEYEMTASDRVLQFASISFDAAAEEIYPCLCSGAALVLRTDTILGSASNFLRYCRDQQISVLDLPTAYWHQLTAEVVNLHEPLPASLRLVIIGGEQALLERVVQWQNWVNTQVQHAGMPRSPQLINTYGPTETTVVATLYKVPPNVAAEESGVPIGRSLPNVQTYVLDRHLQPVPVGVPGELHIGGVGLARGYLNRPDLAAQQFIPNPFSCEPGARLYKTGDLVKYRADGQLEFLGRIDDQVKIRGFRIELGEVEAILTQHPQIREAVVTVQSDQSTEKRLLAYIVPSAQQPLTLPDLRRHLKERLPEYMIPSAFVVLDAIPLTPTGKVDRRILPTLNATHLTLENDFVEPRTSTEATLAGFWMDLLKVDQLSIYDNFFELGGHSLLAAQLVARIADAFGVELPLRSVFESATVAELAERIETMLWVRQASTLQTAQLDECEEGEL